MGDLDTKNFTNQGCAAIFHSNVLQLEIEAQMEHEIYRN